jgi:hypothetical protein
VPCNKAQQLILLLILLLAVALAAVQVMEVQQVVVGVQQQVLFL